MKNFCLSTTWRQIGRIEVQFYPFLTSALDVCKWSQSLPGRFTSWKRLRYPLNRKLHGSHSRSGLLTEKKLLPQTGLKLLTIQKVASRFFLKAILILGIQVIVYHQWRIFEHRHLSEWKHLWCCWVNDMWTVWWCCILQSDHDDLSVYSNNENSLASKTLHLLHVF
jgi:hypothetical protein